MATITSTGLGSGLDINGMVTKLVAAERSAADTRNTTRETNDNAKITALGNFKSALSDFKTSLTTLSQTSSFQKITANSSDTSIITASALSVAEVASYQVEVKSTAQSHALASKAYADPTTVIGSGTLTINFGTTDYDATSKTYNGFTPNANKPSLTLNIDSTNNSLVGIRDAVNKANAGVTASIVNDGTGNRLVFKSSDTGLSNSMQIKVAESGAAGLSDLAFDSSSAQMTQTQAAKDAVLNINGLDVSNASNTISTALKGVTFTLQQAQVGKTVTINVNRQSEELTTAINGFVEKYNALVANVKSNTSYDTTTKTAGILMGESVVQSGMVQIRSMLTSALTSSSGISTLSDVGISIQKDGSLKFDTDKFTKAQNTDIDSVTALFSVLGRTSDSKVQYISSSKETVAGTYAINITQAATQASLETSTLSFPLTVDGTNNNLTVNVNGLKSGIIALTQKTYNNGSDLASELEDRINADATLKASNLTVNVDFDTTNNRLVIKSNTYGASSQFEIVEGSASLGLSPALGTAGVDVAGTINGVTATGKGQFLTSSLGDAKGLKLLIDDTTLGDRGNVTFSRSILDKLSSTIDGLLSSNGSLNSRTSGLQNDLSEVAKAKTALNERMEKYQQRLLAQFNAMDQLIGSMQATSSFLTQQITAYNNANSNN